MSAEMTVNTALPDRPYRGIEPFRYVDHPIFFARQDETQKLLRLITVYRCVLLYGESGSGKSSLINAGFSPAAIDFAPERLRVQAARDGEIVVERTSLREEGKPPYLPSYFATQNDGSARIVLSASAFRNRLMLFQAEDVTDPEGLVSRLKSSPDLVSVFLRSRLNASTQQLLDKYEERQTVSDELLAALLADLNHQILRRTDLYDEKRFKDVPLASELRQLMAQPLIGQGQIVCNRMLLQEAYHHEIQLKPRPLLILDQFEEIVTLFEEVPRDRDELDTASKAQRVLLEILAAMLQDSVLPVKLLFVFREDYLAKIRKRFAPLFNLPEQFLYLVPPGLPSLHKIIRGPFETFPGHFANELSENLSQKLATQMRERCETGHLNLSEVQIACQQLWLADNPDDLFQQKGVQGLLEDYLSEALRDLPNELYDPALALLSRMVTRTGARNPISEDDLLDLPKYDNAFSLERLRTALHALQTQARLVVRESRRDTAVYEITSEYLSPWIRDHRLQFEKRLAEQQAKQERRKKQRAIMLAATIFALALILGLFAGRKINRQDVSIASLSVAQREQAQRFLREAQEAQRIADQSMLMAKNELTRIQSEKKELDLDLARKKKELATLNKQVEPLREELARSQKKIEFVENRNQLLERAIGTVRTISDTRDDLRARLLSADAAQAAEAEVRIRSILRTLYPSAQVAEATTREQLFRLLQDKIAEASRNRDQALLDKIRAALVAP